MMIAILTVALISRCSLRNLLRLALRPSANTADIVDRRVGRSAWRRGIFTDRRKLGVREGDNSSDDDEDVRLRL